MKKRSNPVSAKVAPNALMIGTASIERSKKNGVFGAREVIDFRTFRYTELLGTVDKKFESKHGNPPLSSSRQ